MPFLAAALALFFPRIMIIVLYFFTDWFAGLWQGAIIPILGFLFMPVSLLWYSVVMNYMDGWSTASIVGMVVAVIIDLGLWKRGTKR